MSQSLKDNEGSQYLRRLGDVLNGSTIKHSPWGSDILTDSTGSRTSLSRTLMERCLGVNEEVSSCDLVKADVGVCRGQVLRKAPVPDEAAYRVYPERL